MLANFSEEEQKYLIEILKNGVKFYDFLITSSDKMIEEGENVDDVIKEIIDNENEFELVKYLIQTDLIEKIKNL